MRSMAIGHVESQPFVSQLIVEVSAYLGYQEWISGFIRVTIVILNTTTQVMVGRTVDVGCIVQLHLHLTNRH